MGPQGSGKGTQGEMLSEYLGIPLISVGGLLREMPKTHPRNKEAEEYMERGELVPYDIAAELIQERISLPDCINGYILDGWAREKGNLEYFNPGFDLVLHILIPREESVKRITGRRICSSDGETYNIYTLPKEELEKCKGNLIQREDDTEEAVNRRLDIYYNETQKVINDFEKEGLLIEIDGVGTPEEVFERVKSALDVRKNGR